MKNLFSLLFIFSNTIIFSQRQIFAKIDIDSFANIHVSQYNNFTEKDTLNISKDVLIHSKYAKLLGNKSDEAILYLLHNKKDSLFYSINPPSKRGNNEFQANKDYIFTSLEYLALPINKSQKKNNFNLTFNSPNYKIIYPTPEDLEKQYKTTPPLVAGKFTQLVNNNFNIYFLQQDEQYSPKIKGISDELIKSYNFYSNLLGKNIRPKIIFVPFTGTLYGRTFEDVILFNNNLYTKDEENRRLIAHELSHIWFGTGSLAFDNERMTEGIADFLALQYLKSEGDQNLLRSLFIQRYYSSEGFNSLKGIFEKRKSGKDKYNISYSLIPIALHMRQKGDPSFMNDLSNFYKMHKSDGKVSIEEFENYLKSQHKVRLFSENKLPNFFVIDCENNKACILSSNVDYPIKLEIETTTLDNNISYETLNFKQGEYKKIINAEKLTKIRIDPKFNILQGTRLDDIWIKSEKSLLQKNIYFQYEKLNPKISEISNKIISFLKEKDNDDVFNILSFEGKGKEELIELKTNNFNGENIILSGASARLDEENRMLELLISYYDKQGKEYNTLSLNIGLNYEFTTVKKIFINSTDVDKEKN